MKVALINAPRLFFKDEAFLLTPPPIGLARIYGYLKKKKINTSFFDLNTMLMKKKELFLEFSRIRADIDIEEFCKKHIELIEKSLEYFLSEIKIKKYDIAGISILENNSMKLIVPFLRKIKKINPCIKTVIGTLFIDSIKKEYFSEGIVDFIVNGEGEDILYSIINSVKDNKNQKDNKIQYEIPSIIYLDGQKLIQTKKSNSNIFFKQVIEYDKKNLDEYRFLNNEYNMFNDFFNTPLLAYIPSKGCEFKCTFCSTSDDNRMSINTPEKIVDDLFQLVKKYSYKYFYFYDHHISISRKFLNELCDNIIDRRLDILWSDAIKPLGFLTQEIYYKLRKAGCIKLSFGIETGSEKIMRLMNKGHSVKDCEKNLRFAHNAGIWTEAFFITGFPREGKKEFNETLEFIRRNIKYIDSTPSGKFMLTRNTDIFNNPEKYGIRIINKEKDIPSMVGTYIKYEDLKGVSFEELQKINETRAQILNAFFNKLKKSDINMSFPRTLLFPLYDYLESKEKVRIFLEGNHELIGREKPGYFSLFTGAQSNQKMKGNLHECSIKEFRNIKLKKIIIKLEEIYNEGYRKLIVFGGEPLIRKDLFEILSEAKKIGFEYIIIKTNARMLQYRSFCKKLSQYVDEILVISPSDNENEYDLISGINGSFLQAKLGIENWKKLGKKTRYYSTEKQ